MQISIAYVHHNCFVLTTPGRTYLFDYPGDDHLPAGGEALVRERVADSDLVVFVSHSHDDHLNKDMETMVATARKVRYVFSDDVEDMRPEAIPSGCDHLIVEPDEAYEYGPLSIRTLMSNDLGVAFLVEDGDFRFYYGGDLAKWIWKSASRQEASFTSAFFREAMDKVRAFAPHVVFSNVDRRLENLAGGAEAYSESGGLVFVPMHAFGDTWWLKDFRQQVGEDGAELFIYSEPGDCGEFDI